MRNEKSKRFIKTLGPGILFASTAIGVSHLVQSTRGPSGGYLLAKPPEQIRLLSIIRAVDEKIKTVG